MDSIYDEEGRPFASRGDRGEEGEERWRRGAPLPVAKSALPVVELALPVAKSALPKNTPESIHFSFSFIS